MDFFSIGYLQTDKITMLNHNQSPTILLCICIVWSIIYKVMYDIQSVLFVSATHLLWQKLAFESFNVWYIFIFCFDSLCEYCYFSFMFIFCHYWKVITGMLWKILVMLCICYWNKCFVSKYFGQSSFRLHVHVWVIVHIYVQYTMYYWSKIWTNLFRWWLLLFKMSILVYGIWLLNVIMDKSATVNHDHL